MSGKFYPNFFRVPNYQECSDLKKLLWVVAPKKDIFLKFHNNLRSLFNGDVELVKTLSYLFIYFGKIKNRISKS